MANAGRRLASVCTFVGSLSNKEKFRSCIIESSSAKVESSSGDLGRSFGKLNKLSFARTTLPIIVLVDVSSDWVILTCLLGISITTGEKDSKPDLGLEEELSGDATSFIASDGDCSSVFQKPARSKLFPELIG